MGVTCLLLLSSFYYRQTNVLNFFAHNFMLFFLFSDSSILFEDMYPYCSVMMMSNLILSGIIIVDKVMGGPLIVFFCWLVHYNTYLGTLFTFLTKSEYSYSFGSINIHEILK